MLSCGALERINNPYIELIAELCFSKNQKSESEFVFLRNVNLLFKKNFKKAKLFTKAAFFLYFRDYP